MARRRNADGTSTVVDLELVASTDEPKSRHTSLQLALDLLVDKVKEYEQASHIRFGYANGSWHVYRLGYWSVMRPREREDMARTLNELCEAVGLVYAQKRSIVDTHLTVAMAFRIDPEEFDVLPYVAVHNGTVNLETGELVLHDPAHWTTRFIDIDFDPDAACPEWERMVADIFSGAEKPADAVQFVQEWMGYALAGGADERTPRALRKALFLYGPPKCGKSTFFNVVRQLLGTDRIVTSTPASVADRFGVESFLTAAAWITEEVDSVRRGIDTSRIKCLITGEPIAAQRKGEKDSVLRFNGPVGWAGNTPPNFLESSNAVYDRIVVIQVERVFTEDEAAGKFGAANSPVEWLYEIGEMPGIFNWALAGYKRLLARGKYEKVPEFQSAGDAMRETNDPTFAFVRDCCEEDPAVFNSAPTLAWAAMMYVRATSADKWLKLQALKMQLNNAVPEVLRKVKVQRQRIEEGRLVTYTGLRLNETGLAYFTQAQTEFEAPKKLKANEPVLFQGPRAAAE